MKRLIKRSGFSWFDKPLLFWLMALLYIGCIVIADRSAEKLYGSGKVLLHAPQAWTGEALPWLLACVLAVGMARAHVWERRAVQICVPVVISLTITVWLITQPVAYSMDILRYMWDGRLLLHGVNPFAYVPVDPHLAHFRNWPYWGQMGWKYWPEAYPPVAQIYFGVVAFFTNGSVLQYKALLLINDVVTMVLFYAVLIQRRRAHQEPGAHRLTDKDVQQFALFALFPPLLVESFGAGHVDVFAIPWLLLAWLFRLQNKPGRMGFAIAMATCIKIYPIVLFAALWDRRDWRSIRTSLIAFVLTVAIVYLPFLSVGHDLLAFFSHVSQMGYNGSLEYVLSKWFGAVIDQHATLLVFAVELGMWYIVLFTRVSELPMERKVCLLGLTFILASPVMHPWYVLSFLPFAIVAGDFATLWLAVMSHLTYDEVPLDMYIEYVPTYGFFLWQFLKARKHRDKVSVPYR